MKGETQGGDWKHPCGLLCLAKCCWPQSQTLSGLILFFWWSRIQYYDGLINYGSYTDKQQGHLH